MTEALDNNAKHALFCVNLAQLTQETGLLDIDIAFLLSCTHSYISQIKGGHHQVSAPLFERLEYLCRFLAKEIVVMKKPIAAKRKVETTGEYRVRKEQLIINLKAKFLNFLTAFDKEG